MDPLKSPVNGNELVLGSEGELRFWYDPQGSGLAVTLSEAYDVAQEDEIENLWKLAKTAPPSPLMSPQGGKPMVRVVLGYDDDEASEGHSGDGPDSGQLTVDVDVVNQFIWFDAGELELLPRDKPDAEPTPDQEAQLENIVGVFGEQYEILSDARYAQDHPVTASLMRGTANHEGLTNWMERTGKFTERMTGGHPS